MKNNHRTVSQEWIPSFRTEIKAMKGRRMWKRQSWRKPVFASASHVHLPSAQDACSRISATLQIQKQPHKSSQARTYHLHVYTDAFTTNLLLKVSLISKEIHAESVSLTITIDGFIYYWWRIKERTSSSFSGQNFGNYRLQPTVPVPSLYWEYKCPEDQIGSADRVSLQALGCRLVGRIGKQMQKS